MLDFNHQGIAFIEFYEPKYATLFLEEIVSPQLARKFNQKRWPIIEYAFEDMRILSKINSIRAPKPRPETSIKDKPTERDLEKKVELIKKKETKAKEKLSGQNDKALVRLRLQEYSADKDNAKKEDILKIFGLAKKNRGLRQKIKKRFPQFFEQEEAAPAPAEKKKGEKKGGEKKEKKQLEKREPDVTRKEEDKILRQIQKKKKAKELRAEAEDPLEVTCFL